MNVGGHHRSGQVIDHHGQIMLHKIFLTWEKNNVKHINNGGGTQRVRLTHKKIRYCQIQEVVIALSPQTLVHFKSQDDQRVAQNYHHHQSHHHHHQKDKHGSRIGGVALNASFAKIVATRLGVPLLLRHFH